MRSSKYSSLVIWALSLSSILLSFGTLAQTPEYDRSEWRHWSDFDGDCQNTRQELLISTSYAPVTFTDARECTIKTGLWLEPYTKTIITVASDLDIDHVIALEYAHRNGGARWLPLLKKVFANDPDNLLVTDASENRSKSSRGPSQYMPPNKDYHCEYIRRWRFLVSKYELDIDIADTRVIREIRRECMQ